MKGCVKCAAVDLASPMAWKYHHSPGQDGCCKGAKRALLCTGKAVRQAFLPHPVPTELCYKKVIIQSQSGDLSGEEKATCSPGLSIFLPFIVSLGDSGISV